MSLKMNSRGEAWLNSQPLKSDHLTVVEPAKETVEAIARRAAGLPDLVEDPNADVVVSAARKAAGLPDLEVDSSLEMDSSEDKIVAAARRAAGLG